MLLFAALVLGIAAALAATSSMGKTSGLGLEAWFPGDPALDMAEAGRQIRAGNGAVPHKLIDRVNQAGRLDPFAAEPFLAAALARPSTGRPGARLRLLEEARRRNPRDSGARIFLLDEYLRLAKAGAAIDEIAVLLRLLPGSEQALLPVLTRLITDPDTRPQALAALAANPLRQPLLRDLATANASPFLLVALTPDLAGAARREADRRWLPAVIDPYVARGDIPAAWQLWTHFGGIAPDPRGLLRDGDFAGRFAPPFGWELSDKSGGLAETRGRWLRVTDYGRIGWTPARQLLRLPPGGYRLAFGTRGVSGEAPELSWRIECVGKGGRLLDLPIGPPGLFADAAPERFVVPPEGCEGQWLSLVVRAAAFRRTRSGAVGDVRVMPEPTP